MKKKLKIVIKTLISRYNLNKTLVKSNSSKFIYIGSPLHGNIGDHAISIAILNILKECNMPVVEIPGERYMLNQKKIQKYVKNDDVIVITGGGLIGNLWMNEEEMIKNVIESFSNNKIIVMPQTFFFDDNKDGCGELKSLSDVINNHSDIYLCARDNSSYQLCLKNFKKAKGIYFFPDVVLSLNYCNDLERDGILLCLRDDKEKAMDFSKLINSLNKKCILKRTSTVLNKRISIKDRNNVVRQKLEEFSRANIVITDRLHGMIFSAITGTPCLALDNKSKKVSGVYEWIKDLDYIKFCKNVDEIEYFIGNININKKNKYNLDIKYKEMLVDFINSLIKNNR